MNTIFSFQSTSADLVRVFEVDVLNPSFTTDEIMGTIANPLTSSKLTKAELKEKAEIPLLGLTLRTRPSLQFTLVATYQGGGYMYYLRPRTSEAAGIMGKALNFNFTSVGSLLQNLMLT